MNQNPQERSAAKVKVKEGAITASSSSTDKKEAAVTAAATAPGPSAATTMASPLDYRRKKRRCHSAEMIAMKTATSLSGSDTSFGEGRGILAPR